MSSYMGTTATDAFIFDEGDSSPFNITSSFASEYLNFLQSDHQERILKKSDELVIDFTAFAMAVVTMSLLLIVEIVRHKIDHLAEGKEIFEHVLEAVYRELSTLGIVEAIVFLVQHYYTDMNKTVKQVFYEVHFTLFYVAIFNAIMSCLLYFFASRVAEKQWVRLEKVDLDHYVAIRKQFDAFKEQLQAIKSSKGSMLQSPVTTRPQGDSNVILQMLNDSRIPFLKANLKKMLNMKYRKLLVQVRFHELRVHFIESNDLDPRFCVSTYLKLCMNDVFKSLVHISTFSWLILLGCTNLVYFAMGIITAETNDKTVVGISLSFIYIGYAVFFVIFSAIVGWKVKKIFFTIMKHEEWVKRNESGRNLKEKAEAQDEFHQLDYFWGSDPTIIIVVCQFMQFGFALALGILLVFNENIYDQQSPFQWVGWYFVVPMFCYVLFVRIWSTIIPQYTQCTNLGELVNEKHLNDTRAAFELNEARLLRQDEIDFAELEKKRHIHSRDATVTATKGGSNQKENLQKGNLLKRMMSGSAVNRNAGSKDDSDLRDSLRYSLRSNQKLVELSELVKRPSKDLPEVVPQTMGEGKRSVSAGVASMREGLFSRKSILAAEALGETVPQSQDDVSPIVPFPYAIDETMRGGNRVRPNRTKAVSTGVFLMQSERSLPMFEVGKVKENTNKLQTPLEVLDEKISEAELAKTYQDKESMYKDIQSLKHKHPPIISIREEECLVRPSPEEEEDEKSDAVPDITGIDAYENAKQKKDITSWLEHIFMKKSYRQASAVFGTMVAFFMIAIRIELILLDTCFISDNQNTWNFITRQAAFWIFVIWLCGFIVEGCTQIYLFRKSGTSPYMILSGIFDCLLSVVCLAIFLRAEVERCCDCETTSLVRFLELSEDSKQTCEPFHPCCPEFGERLCGGVGKLEPIASIIAFRVMRFYVAKKLWRLYTKLRKGMGNAKHSEEDSSLSQELMVEFTSKRREKAKDKLCHSHDVDFEHSTGTIAKLWSSALLKYPDIVSEHGMFSGILLEAMLGIDRSPTENDITLHEPGEGVRGIDVHEKLPTAPSTSRWKYMVDRHAHKSNSEILSSIGDDWNEDSEYHFIRPEAPLIRKMRRCQCKWLPLLDEWQVVDVVVTKYELVWMEPESAVDSWEKDVDHKNDAIARMFSDDKGGRGLSLCDAVTGRKVIGRLPLCDIYQIKIHRFAPGEMSTADLSQVHEDMDVETAPAEDNNFSIEYWEERRRSTNQRTATSMSNPDERFSHVMEDHLVLFSEQGTLYLRFLVDLVEEENTGYRSAVDLYSFNRKEGALLWCQTLAHICGPQQLKQKLHHMGEEKDKELLDFVEIHDKKKGEKSFTTRFLGRH